MVVFLLDGLMRGSVLDWLMGGSVQGGSVGESVLGGLWEGVYWMGR